MKYAISSNRTFAPITLERVVSSLLEAGIPKDDIYVFEGDNPVYEYVTGKIVHYYKVPHNSMDFNALIAILELNLESDYWFLLHDTCHVGSEFRSLITTPTVLVKPLCSQGLSMNIGAYSMEYLRSRKEDIMALKCYGDLAIFKAHLVATEDCLLNGYKDDAYTDHYIISEPTDIYGNGVMRVIQCYPQIQLCKSKANWCPKDIYELNL